MARSIINMTRTVAGRRRAIINYPNSLNFPGTNGSHLHIGTNVYAPERTSAWSIAYWILPKNNNVVNAHIFAEIDSSLPFRGRIVRYTASICYIWLLNTFNTNECYAGYKVPPVGRWTRVVHTYDGSSNSSGIKTYYNNILQTQTTTKNALSATIIPSAASTRWGGWGGASGNYPMYLAAPAHLDYEMTAQQVADDWYKPNTGTTPVDKYDLTEGSGTSVASTGSGAHNGTIAGSVTWSSTVGPMKARSVIPQTRLAVS